VSGTGDWPARVRAAYDGRLPGAATVADDGFGLLLVDVPALRWLEAVSVARDLLGLSFFDWLSAVDETDPARPGEGGLRLACHLAGHRPGHVRHLLLRALLDRDRPTAPSVAEVYAGAAWHERETHEMFGVDFTRDGEVLDLAPLLLPDDFEGHPLRKDFVLASRVAKAWPGAKEPGESDAGPQQTRRRPRAPGVPDPDAWGPRPAGPDGDGRG
jgi:NADH:ubiquinone oxidoreductase subunit C